ncbi:MAG: alpha-glucan family phosphorylase [Bacteroidetes bacterium]|nr:alpha-glucan family phosphorylase [Bacteroidota bacterium]
MTKQEIFGYTPDPKYKKTVAYFSMEFAIDQALKTYSGGLGFLAGSHMRSAYELKQSVIGIGMLWKYGYYDQWREINADMKVTFIEKGYSFIEDTGIMFTVPVHDSPVHVRAFLLRPQTFNSAPIFLLTTNLNENDEQSRSISYKLYDSTESTRIAQSIILGIGGAMLLDKLGLDVDIYHMNEGHSLPLNFYLYKKYKSLDEVRKRVVFTTHTPEAAGNEEHNYDLLKKMSFYYGMEVSEVKNLLAIDGYNLNYTLAALKFAKKANGVSKLHGEVAREMWNSNPEICDITSITNAQNKTYWKDDQLEQALAGKDDKAIIARKKELKRELFKLIANQCGKLFDENVLTIVWARRFAGYKRADLITYDWDRFIKLVYNSEMPVQLIWAGKPYPEDYGAINQFNQIIRKMWPFANCAVLTGYELGLSAMLKKGSDLWLNNPRMYREASGTSGMTAAMNASINLSLPDGWVPEFAKDKQNCFVIPPADDHLSPQEKDQLECQSLLDIIDNVIRPMYYNDQKKWVGMIRKAAADVVPMFDSGRMADEYYRIMYNA